MDRGARAMNDSLDAEPRGEQSVVPLSPEIPTHVVEAPPSPPGRLHGIAIAGLGLSALTGIVSTLAFITVRWPAHTGRYVVAAIIASVVAFLGCASTAIFTAARDTDRKSVV